MSSSDVKGILVSPARLGFLLSLIALGTFGWNTGGTVMAAMMQVEANAAYIESDKIATREILKELQTINRKVDELSIYMQAHDIVPKN